MINNETNDCLDQERQIPIIHFHGTSDPVVNYYSPSFDGALTVDESIDFLDIITKHKNSKPTVNLKINNSYAFYVSVSHEKDYAIAVVISQ